MDDAIRYLGEGQVVRHDRNGAAALSAAVLQEAQYLLARPVVESPRGLVAEQELGVLRQGARDGDALLLPTRELRGEVVHAPRQADLVEHLGGGERILADLTGELHVLECGEILDQVVELEDEPDVVTTVLGQLAPPHRAHERAIQADVATRARVHAAQHVEDRGLARAGRSHDDHELATLYGEAHAVDGMDLDVTHLIGLANVGELDEGHGTPPS